MKNTIKLLIAFISILTLSCTEDVEQKTAEAKSPGISLLAPTSSFNLILDGAKLDELATTFVWNDTENSTAGTSVSYTIEAAKSGTDFAAPVALGTTTNLFKDITVGNLDSAAKAIGLPALVEGLMDVRVKSSAGTSNSYTIKVTPYQPNWGIIGDATPAGWGLSTDMIYNAEAGTYSISLALTTGEFKFRLDNSWTTNYGDNGNNLSLEGGGSNIPVTAGNYTIVANFTTNTYTITPIVDAWGVIGDATPTGWDNDTLMDYNPTTKTYSIIMKMKVGTFKFRLNHGWDSNYGDNGNDLTLDAGGSNVAITTAGTYYITADFTGLNYTIKQL
nr:SusE domain-containing protein [uncultured Flavobacterium sp.]